MRSPASEHRSAPGLVVLAAALLVATAPAGGQQPAPEVDVKALPEVDATSSFSEVIEVRTVNLEVVVTDRNGRRVTGLQPEDFVLTVDGRELPIDYFSEVVAGWSAGGRAGGTGPAPVVAAGDAVGTNYLVYFDDNRTLKTTRDIVVHSLLDQLDALGPADRMAVVVHSGPRLFKLTSWTQDRAELRSALERLLDGREFGGSLRSQIFLPRTPQSRSTQAAGPIRPDSRFNPARIEGPVTLRSAGGLDGYRDATLGRIDLELAVDAAMSTMRGLYRSSGRRVMLMVGGDWPIGAFPTKSGETGFISDLDLLRVLVDTANLLGYTLYPVGLRNTNIWANANLGYLAEHTGGRPLFERTTVLTDATDDTRSYYWLGFTPDFGRNDQRHRIEVEVRDPGLRVRNRSGYLDLSRETRVEMASQGALFFGEDEVVQSLTLAAGTPSRFAMRKMRVPLDVRIPLALLSFLPGANGDVADLELRFVVIDGSGYQTDEIPSLPLTIARGEIGSADEHVYTTSLLMRRRPHELVVSVHDRASGQTLFGRTQIRP